jgi:hypothetical protein
MGIWTNGTGVQVDAAAEACLSEDRAVDTALAEMRAYWQALRRQGALPRRQDIQPRGMAGVLPGAFMVERTAPGVGRLRIAGQMLGDLIGMDAAGMPLVALFDPQARAHLSALLEICLLRPATLEMTFTCDAGPDAPALHGKLAILPIESDGTRGELGLGVLALTGRIGRAPRHLILTGARTTRIDLPRYHKLTELEDFSILPAPGPIRPFAVKPTRSGRPYLQLVDLAR